MVFFNDISNHVKSSFNVILDPQAILNNSDLVIDVDNAASIFAWTTFLM